MSDLAIRARGLLDFALQSVDEGLKDSTQAAECFNDADHAFRILRKALLKEDQFRHAQLALMGAFDTSFLGISRNEDQNERDQYMREACDKLTFAKTLFDF